MPRTYHLTVGATPSSQGAPLYRPVQFPDLATARLTLHAPADANYVTWPAGKVDSPSLMLEEVFMGMTDNDILVLPERVAPYEIDSADGFRAAGVSWVSNTGPTGTQIPIVNTYKGQPARTWFSMTRTRRGILGLGPQVVIQPSASSFNRGQQAMPPNLVTSTGQVITGCQESLMESDNIPNPYYGNFTLTSRDFGGVAYNGLKIHSTSVVYENLFMNGAHRSFDKEPNGETGGITTNAGTYAIYNVEVDGRDTSTGIGAGASPFMFSSCTGGLIQGAYAHNCEFPWIQGGILGGGPAWWSCSNLHSINDFRCETPGSFNMEINTSTFLADWHRGTIFANMSSGVARMHFNVRSATNSQKLHFQNVTLAGGRFTGYMDVQSYIGSGETMNQLIGDITCTNPAGTTIPIHLA